MPPKISRPFGWISGLEAGCIQFEIDGTNIGAPLISVPNFGKVRMHRTLPFQTQNLFVVMEIDCPSVTHRARPCEESLECFLAYAMMFRSKDRNHPVAARSCRLSISSQNRMGLKAS